MSGNETVPAQVETKLAALLKQNGYSQSDLYHLIQGITGKEIGRDRISKMVRGQLTNISVETAKTIAQALNVTIDEIID